MKMRPPPSLNSKFFSSLKQVEKRLKLENPAPPPLPEVAVESELQAGSLSSPIFVHVDQETNNSKENSEPPFAFLSCSHQNPPPETSMKEHQTTNLAKSDDLDGVDDIEVLMQLLGLEKAYQVEEIREENDFGEDDSFYEKIVGVKGPKCRKEMERLDGWIKYFLSIDGEKKIEPLRLAFLLLGKAATEMEAGSGGDHGGFYGLEFPSAIEEFLKVDPTENMRNEDTKLTRWILE